MISVINKRKLLFLGLCIPVRLSILYLGKFLVNKSEYNIYKKLLSIATFLMGLGFLNIYFFGSKRADAQLKWAGEPKVWWNDLRIAHGICYLLFSFFLFYDYKFSWFFIFAEILFGLLAWIKQIYINNQYFLT